MADRATYKSAYDGMLAVTEESFFRTVGGMDVMPSVASNYDDAIGYVSHWKTREGLVVGATLGGTDVVPPTFMVTSAFYSANKHKLTQTKDEPCDN